MVISFVEAFVLSLLNKTDSSNETDCLPTLSGLLKSYLLNGTQGDTCSFAEFNNHSIKGTLHYVCRGRYGYDYVKHRVYSIGIPIHTLFIFAYLSPDLPAPSECMVNNGTSSRYVSCEEKYQSGCQKILNSESYTVSLYQQS